MKKMKISIKNSTVICPAKDSPNQSYWLSNLDLRFLNFQNSLLYLYKSNGPSNAIKIQVLKEAMSKVLRAFYPVAGRLGRGENGRIQIDCNSKGVLFIEAEADCALGELGDSMLNAQISQLIPVVDYSTGISSFPLFVVQVTIFTCGILSLGIRWHHILGDGSSAANFINTWCDLARGNLPMNISPLFLDRTILHSKTPPNPTFEHIELRRPPKSIKTSQAKNISVEIFEITLDQVKTLKTMVKDKYSIYKILTAHIWRSACKARVLSDDQTTTLLISVDVRFRLHPPLQPGYFGNAVFVCVAVALSKNMLTEPLNDTVARIDRAIKRVDDKYLRSAIDYLQLQNDKDPLMQEFQRCRCPNLSITSLMRIPFYEADFGLGKPMHMSPVNLPEGKGYILPNPRKKGSWKLTICLETNHMQAFRKHLYECAAISNICSKL